MKIILLAGGTGTRLWPLSRNSHPKQFTQLLGDQTLFQQTYARVAEEYDVNDIYVSTNNSFVERVKKEIPQIPDDHFIIEPEKRDTAPAMGYVAAILFRECPDEPIAFIPSDHIIKDTDLFLRSLQVADKTIRETGKMLDIGVVPTFPNTNLGYTHVGERIAEEDGVEIWSFLGHTEKPPAEVAQRYIDLGEYLWHASYYMWTPRKFLEAFQTYQPEMSAHLSAIAETSDKNTREQHFCAMERISFDYAITERMSPSDVLIIPAPFVWSDVGQWRVVKEHQEENSEDNVTKGDTVSIDTEDCLIYSKKDKVVATVGLKGMIIVDTDDALLICPKDRDQDVKKIVELLKERGEEHYL